MTASAITPELLARYDRPGPRYTSYPTVPEWSADFGGEQYRGALTEAAASPDIPLSLYVHIPFCPHRCAYCGCTTITAPSENLVSRYLADVTLEVEHAASLLGKRNTVSQCHWGGGTPTSLNADQMGRLFGALTDRFTFDADAEVAIETNPNSVTRAQLDLLREFGFNRISFGVQDLNPEVQRAIGRNQTAERTEEMLRYCRGLGFSGINMDLIYGLPLQTMEPWMRTLEQVAAMRPDRIAIYSYAHLSSRFAHQQALDPLPRPGTTEKYALFAAARNHLVEAGYRPIGMDHFALPGDELARSLDNRTLHRNFMGYTVRQAPDQIGFGLSAISEVSNCYAQNTKDPDLYHSALERGDLPVERGMRLSRDDVIRRWAIRRLMCAFELDLVQATALFGINCNQYFSAECVLLEAYQAEGMIDLGPEYWRVTPLGAPFIRNICMVFDAYLKSSSKTLYSRTI
ncbi:MAG TPA: oxygen-independent coproporphyrinogen III oxidase [Candidatus Hydrogenedentes bacterium]|nr:oxygen-independent coproporphyrinogen III oxidase [Candidatus Hydrogenedentota bacterium]